MGRELSRGRKSNGGGGGGWWLVVGDGGEIKSPQNKKEYRKEKNMFVIVEVGDGGNVLCVVW